MEEVNQNFVPEDFLDIDAELEEIENKYCPPPLSPPPALKHLKKDIFALSRDFDALGIPLLKPNQPLHKILDDVIKNTFMLISIHRKTLSKVQDTEITTQSKESKNSDLLKQMEAYKKQIKEITNKQFSLMNYTEKLESQITEFGKKEAKFADDIKKIKLYHNTKEAQLLRKMKKLDLESFALKQKFGKEIGKYVPKDDTTANWITDYKKREQAYNEIIGKLNGNVTCLTDELLSCQEDKLNLQQELDRKNLVLSELSR